MKEIIADGQFRSTYHRSRANILYTAIWLNEYVRKFMEQYGLTPQQHNILRIVYNSDKPMNVLQIRDRMFEKLSDASRLIDRLEAKGLLKKKKSTSDKRLVEITLTEDGKLLTEKIAAAILQLDEPLKGLNQVEADTLSDLLEKMRNNGFKNFVR